MGLSESRSGSIAKEPASGLLIQNVRVNGHRTSIRLEPAFWSALQEICRHEGQSVNELCSAVEGRRGRIPRTTAIRVFILSYFHARAQSEIDRLAKELHQSSLASGFETLAGRATSREPQPSSAPPPVAPAA